MIRNQHWYNLNEGRCYPIDDKASMMPDDGERLPSNIITDIRLRYPNFLGEFPFISAVAVTPGAVSVTVQAAATMDNSDNSFVPVAVFSVPIQDLEEGRQYQMEAQYPGTYGYITLGSGVQREYNGRFSSPAQTLLAPKAARVHYGLPVTSMGKLGMSTALTGVVLLRGDAPIEVVKESREIYSVERDVIVIRLVDDPTSAAAGQAEESVFKQYAGPCGKRVESKTCGVPEPIEFVNAVAPDCNGVLCLDFDGIIVVGRNQDDCGIVLDMPFGASQACLPPYLPDHDGILPYEKDPVNVTPPPDPEPEIPPDESVSDEIIVIGELPYCDGFDGFVADGFVVMSGEFVFISDQSPNPECGEAVSSYAAEGPNSASQRNVAVWEGFDVTTFYRFVETDVKLLQGPAGAKHNGGIVINHREHGSRPDLYVYYLAEIDYDNQEFSLKRWNGTTFQQIVFVSIPGIMLEDWYRIRVSIQPGAGSNVFITAYLEGQDDPTIQATIGPVMTSNYRPEDGYFGFGTNRAIARFSFFHLDESS